MKVYSEVARLVLSCMIVLSVISGYAAAEGMIEDFSDNKVGEMPPADWAVYHAWVKNIGPDASYEVVADGIKGNGLHVISKAAAVAIYRDVDLEPGDLSWAWKAVKLPAGGAEDKQATSDCALYVWLFFEDNTAFHYDWSTTLEIGTIGKDPWANGTGNSKFLVLESGEERLNEWVWEFRNVAEDYKVVWDTKAPNITKILLFGDSDNTNSDSEGYFDEIGMNVKGVDAQGKLSVTWGSMKRR